jgi:hypothetical protein
MYLADGALFLLVRKGLTGILPAIPPAIPRAILRALKSRDGIDGNYIVKLQSEDLLGLYLRYIKPHTRIDMVISLIIGQARTHGSVNMHKRGTPNISFTS